MISQGNSGITRFPKFSLAATSSAGPATSSKGVAGSENNERTGTSAPADPFLIRDVPAGAARPPRHSRRRPGLRHAGWQAAPSRRSRWTRPRSPSGSRSDRERMYLDQEPVRAPLTLEEAAARAIKYNLDYRLQLMESALQQGVLEVSQFDMLPRLTASAGYVTRDNEFFLAVPDARRALRPGSSLQPLDRKLAPPGRRGVFLEPARFRRLLLPCARAIRPGADRAGAQAQGDPERHAGCAQRLLARARRTAAFAADGRSARAHRDGAGAGARDREAGVAAGTAGARLSARPAGYDHPVADAPPGSRAVPVGAGCADEPATGHEIFVVGPGRGRAAAAARHDCRTRGRGA